MFAKNYFCNKNSEEIQSKVQLSKKQLDFFLYFLRQIFNFSYWRIFLTFSKLRLPKIFWINVSKIISYWLNSPINAVHYNTYPANFELHIFLHRRSPITNSAYYRYTHTPPIIIAPSPLSTLVRAATVCENFNSRKQFSN